MIELVQEKPSAGRKLRTIIELFLHYTRLLLCTITRALLWKPVQHSNPSIRCRFASVRPRARGSTIFEGAPMGGCGERLQHIFGLLARDGARGNWLRCLCRGCVHLFLSSVFRPVRAGLDRCSACHSRQRHARTTNRARAGARTPLFARLAFSERETLPPCYNVIRTNTIHQSQCSTAIVNATPACLQFRRGRGGEGGRRFGGAIQMFIVAHTCHHTECRHCRARGHVVALYVMYSEPGGGGETE